MFLHILLHRSFIEYEICNGSTHCEQCGGWGISAFLCPYCRKRFAVNDKEECTTAESNIFFRCAFDFVYLTNWP